jgi:hypothetical protein
VERATENSSASSALVLLSGSPEFDEVRFLRWLEFGLLAAEPALGLGDLHASLVRILIRSDSNSAIIPRTLNSSRPTGSFGSCSEPPMFSLTPASVSSSTMLRHRSATVPAGPAW